MRAGRSVCKDAWRGPLWGHGLRRSGETKERVLDKTVVGCGRHEKPTERFSDRVCLVANRVGGHVESALSDDKISDRERGLGAFSAVHCEPYWVQLFGDNCHLVQ
jgi:hypothetical protein